MADAENIMRNVKATIRARRSRVLREARSRMAASKRAGKVLHLNLYREFFAAVADGTKRIEYRNRSLFWRSRLEGRVYDFILFRNGYAKDAPEMVVEFRGLRRYGRGRKGYYAILLGRVLKLVRWRVS